jgi:alpha-N-acetylglucosamine transferase
MHGNPAQNQMLKAAQIAIPKYQTDVRIISTSIRDVVRG